MPNDYYAPIPFDQQQICDRIEQMLDALRWSWPELSRRSGVPEAMLQAWRTGELVPRVSEVSSVAEALGIVYPEITIGLTRIDQQRAARRDGPPSSRRAA
jgi:ribosome-binding protein aMBF1 (putative translation factor)